MPRIFDNLAPESRLLPALQETLGLSFRADFCVGYFNLWGWGGLAPYVDNWSDGDGPCRVLIGMQRLPHEDLRDALSLVDRPSGMDNQTAHRLRVQLAEQLRQQLTIGAPTNADERTLRHRYASIRDVFMLFLNGKLAFVWWIAIGDDFHLTLSNFVSAPVGPGHLSNHQRNQLIALFPDLEGAMNDNVVFKLNAGKNMGNYNLARCRHVTDKSDRVWLDALGLSDLWEDIELEHALVVRTSFEDASDE